MKTFLTIAAVAFMATAANAQSMTPADPANSPPSTMTPTPPEDTAAPAPAPAADTSAELVQKDGKWWKGDREATKTEIAEYKKAKKAGRPS